MSSSELVPRPGVVAAAWSSEEAELLRDQMCSGASDAELAFFAKVCRHKGLDPFGGEIIATMRWSAKAQRKVLVIQETVAGLRTIAERTGLYGGQDAPLWCGPDKVWTDVWLDDTPPAAAKVRVYRKDWLEPATGVATYSSYVQLNDKGDPLGLWKTGPDFMLWKCAEAAALKRAFRRQLEEAGVNTREFTPPERVSMEGRLVGLDDEDRHALVREVTGGRTDSSRDLDEAEVLEMRAKIARRRPVSVTSAGPGGTQVTWYDPETGEIVDAPDDAGGPEEVRHGAAGDQLVPGPEPTAPANAQTPAPDETPFPEPKPGERDDIAALKTRIRAGMTPKGWAGLAPWLEACRIAPTLDGVTKARVAAINAELDQRGVAKTAACADDVPPAPTTP